MTRFRAWLSALGLIQLMSGCLLDELIFRCSSKGKLTPLSFLTAQELQVLYMFLLEFHSVAFQALDGGGRLHVCSIAEMGY